MFNNRPALNQNRVTNERYDTQKADLLENLKNNLYVGLWLIALAMGL